ncbi:hypothetical protein DUI87_11111 [Hirundo rustica rustica]|uniref:DNA-repair protein Xrcc1 N-terminal domain-containing protein n=1 Tax=Hirundo rustica rustica TaxID=333673 RepID=A0A3M0KFJ0_HIRRU|nr:hypothetical protein DUI87_11111 [Hirundo rustica rustica]
MPHLGPIAGRGAAPAANQERGGVEPLPDAPLRAHKSGNYGCAFLQIEVGRSSWPRDQPYLTLVPTVTLMTPADSKLDQNRCGVRMFKEADFSELTVGQKWDRVRLTCSQPFSPCSRFGLSFIRLRTPQEPEPDLPRPPPDAVGVSHSSKRSREEEQLRSRLWKLEGAAWSPAHLSRSAQMVLSAARNQELRPRAGTSTLGSHPELPAQDAGGAAVPGESPPAELPPAALLGTPNIRRVWSNSSCFLLDLLPAHASRCGKDPTTAWPFLSPDAWVSCPICQLPFGVAEVEQHASNCGETAGALSSPQCLQ